MFFFICIYLLHRYGLTCPNAILAEEKHAPLFAEIVADPYKPTYVAGGSCQNTIRVAQWMLQKQGATVYTGCVGTDENASILKKCATGDGVTVEYMTQSVLPTGTCACLIKDKDRSMVANLAAANAYKVDHLSQPEVKEIWTSAKNYFVEGYFLTVSVDSILTLAEHASSSGKTFAISLSAPFICEFFVKPLGQVLKHADIVFGNETEAAVLAKSLGVEDASPKGLALYLASKYETVTGRTRTVVITCGADDVVVAVGDKVTTHKVPPMSSKEIVDTNGAGDAFAGGFMAGHVQGKDLDTCVNAGIYSSQVILKTSGTALSGTPTFQW